MAGSGAKISASELAVLKSLWDEGPSTVRELKERLERRGFAWAYTTVQTLVNRLQTKGYASASRKEHAHLYRAAVSRDKLLKRRLGDLARDLCEGASAPLMQALVSGKNWSAQELDDLRRVLDDLSATGGTEPGKRKARLGRPHPGPHPKEGGAP